MHVRPRPSLAYAALALLTAACGAPKGSADGAPRDGAGGAANGTPRDGAGGAANGAPRGGTGGAANGAPRDGAGGTANGALARACRGDCGGPLATVVVYRDAGGVARRYELNGSPGACSHPPTVFFDERGERTGAIPMVAVQPGSARAAGFAAIREQQTAGLTKAEQVRCRQVLGD